MIRAVVKILAPNYQPWPRLPKYKNIYGIGDSKATSEIAIQIVIQGYYVAVKLA